jgi:hypothetical protein
LTRREPFLISYDVKVKEHLLAIEKRYHSLIRTTIEEQLSYDADLETRNRKPLMRDVEFEADWELRFGPDNRFRAFYALDAAEHSVLVLAVGVKRGSKLSIGGEEIQL